MHENSLSILLPVSMDVSASEQIFGTVTDLHSRLVAMQIVVHHAWKTDVSFPSVNSAERNTNEGGTWMYSAWLEELYQVDWITNTDWKNVIRGSLNQ